MKEILVVNNVNKGDARNRSFNSLLFNAAAVITDENYTVLHHETVAEDPAVTNYFGAVILSGVPLTYNFDSIDQYAAELSWLMHSDVPTLGICVGHQSIGRSFGADVQVYTEKEAGRVNLELVAEDALFSGRPPLLQVAAYHNASISVPPDFKLLASSASCANHLMRHEKKLIYGSQGHLEATPSGIALLKRFIDLAQRPPQDETPPLLDIAA